MNFRYMFSVLLCTGIMCATLWTPARSQSYVSEAASNGFTIKKVVSDTAIATGQNFSYTIYFSIPAGAASVTITDVLPPAVSFQSISVTSACGSPTVSTPTVGSTGGTVSLNWASVPSGCSGSFVVTVNFPNGTTCDGATARNRVCLAGRLGATGADFCTGYVSTRAIAEDPWNVGKWILGAGSQPGPCRKITADSVVTYRISAWKDVGTTGQLNLENAVVTDTLPPGAMLVPGSASCGSLTQTGNVITWTIGSLSAMTMYNTQFCTFDVLYPSAIFPTGTQIQNQATLVGDLGSPNASCGPAVHQSNETCVEIKQVTSATFSKYVYTNGQPGCAGRYRIWLCNNGSLPIDTLLVTDTIPSALTGLTLGSASGGLNTSISGNVVTVTLTTPLMPTQCRYVYIEFVIPSSAAPNSTITNCAWLQIPGITPQQACAAFTVNAPEPDPCLWKEICNEQSSYEPGDVFRYRLRIQNIGGQPITGATITDVLDPNLQYVGNPSYYTTSSWNAPCQTTSNWSGVSISQSGNTLNFSLPTIPAECQDIFYSNCGLYGTFGVPFYFIEFDVMVADTSALGNIPNRFTIDGGNLSSTETSNTDYANVVGTSGFFLDKSVAPDTTSWASSTTAAAASNVNYRLQFTVAPGSVGLRHVTFADLLPRNDGTNDSHILGPCGPRGSVFDLGWVSTVATTPAAAPYANPLGLANVNTFTPAGAPGAMFTGGCGTAGSWSGGLSAGDMNLGWYFGSTPIGAGNTATSVFSANIAASAQESDSACNTFAANAAVRHLINSAVISDQQTGSLESNRACVFVEKGQGSEDTCFTAQLKSVTADGTNPDGDCEYTVVLSVTNPALSAVTGWFDSDQGTVTPSSLSIPSGTSTQTLTFTDTPPADNFICLRFGIVTQDQRVLCDSLCFDIPPCGEDEPCDSLAVKQASVTATGVNAVGDCTYEIELSVDNAGSSTTDMWFETIAGSLTPAMISVPSGPSTQTLTFTDTSPADNFVCLRYGYMNAVGQRVLCDSLCFDIPPCEDASCDSLINGSLDTSCCEYDVTIINGVGSPITSIAYTITGGTVDVINTAPCAPVAPAPAGSSSGVLTYSPPCAGSLGFSIQATPSTPGGTVTVQLMVYHGQKDSCRLRFSYACDEDQHTEPKVCDRVKIKPFHFTGLNLSGRTFVVSNAKVPASPITHIDIDPVPVPCFMQGGGLSVDFTTTAWSVPYTRIPATGFISANSQVKFNLGVDYTCNWTGTINLVIHHADGDSCLYTYGPWEADPPVTGGGVVVATGIDSKVYANRLRIENTSSSASIKYVAVNVESDSSVIIAGSGDHWEGTAFNTGDAVLDGYEQGRHEALFSFETPVASNAFSDYFNLVVAQDSTLPGPPRIRWTTFDEDGNAIATDTIRITTPVLSIRGEGRAPAPGDFRLLNSYPSPVHDAATIEYELDRDMHVRLELYDRLGKFVESIDDGFHWSGRRSLRHSTSHLPAGTYYLKLASGGKHVIKPLVIVR